MAVPSGSGAAAYALNVQLADKAFQGTPLAGTGSQLVQAATSQGVDPRLMIAIAKAETSYGNTGNATAIHNPFGYGGMSFPSWGASYLTVAKGLKQNYISKGLHSVAAIQAKWAPIGAGNDPAGLNRNWTRNVSATYASLGGDPNDVTKSISDSGVVAGIQSVPGDAQNALTNNPIADSIGSLTDLLKALADPHLWIRIGEMILGVLSAAGGVALFVKSPGAGKPIGILLFGFGFLWLYTGVKNISPIDAMKSLIGA